MSKLIIEYPQATSEEIEYRDGGNCSKYVHGGQGVGYQPNARAWGLGPYDRYLAIDVDMGYMRQSRMTVEREVCLVETIEEGTWDEWFKFTIVRRKTVHLLDVDELSAAWPEIELRKTEGAKLTVSMPPTILRDPQNVFVYYGI